MKVIFVHGWSANSESMRSVATALAEAGLQFEPYFFEYRSRDDEGTIADFAEGLHEHLKLRGLLQPSHEIVPASEEIPRTLHFVTHSTGALVVRRWFQQYAWARAADRVATVCFLAPANFGSPLAHKGRSLLGRIGKGIRELRDFGETGRRTLEALELASPDQWSIADYDLFGSKGSVYGAEGVRATVVTGASGYGGLAGFVNEDGTDGTIVVSGAGLSCRQYCVDFVAGFESLGWLKRSRRKLPHVPQLILKYPDHGKILKLANDDARHYRHEPDTRNRIVRAIHKTLSSSPQDFEEVAEWFREQNGAERDRRELTDRYQQFIFRLSDDRGDAIPDYTIEFGAWERERIDRSGHYPRPRASLRPKSRERNLSEAIGRHFRDNGHAHSVDSSYRRFLVSPATIDNLLGSEFVLTLKIIADSGDNQIFYATQAFDNFEVYDPLNPGSIKWIFPDTTTLIDMRVDRYTHLTKLTKN